MSVVRLLGIFCLVLAMERDVLATNLGWDRLSVTFQAFSQMPTTEMEANNTGWTKDGSCADNNVFVGNRYVQGGDKSTRLIFDNDGNIAGIQATVTPTDTFPSQIASSPWVMASPTEVVLTAYFRNPNTICGRRHSLKSKEEKRKPKIGNQLYIQLKSWQSPCKVKDKILKVPRKEELLHESQQPWVKGKCFNGMGQHYWYNLSPQLSCEDLFPAFLMYDEKTKLLKAFGWSLNTHVASPRWLHPTKEYFPLFFNLTTIPTCLEKQKISTQHIYLSDPKKLICTQN